MRYEPKCPMCLAKGKRRPLTFEPRRGYWECTATDCGVVVVNQADEDEEEIRERLREVSQTEPHRVAMRADDGAMHPNGHRAPLGSRRGGSSSGRRPKRPQPKPAPVWTLV